MPGQGIGMCKDGSEAVCAELRHLAAHRSFPYIVQREQCQDDTTPPLDRVAV